LASSNTKITGPIIAHHLSSRWSYHLTSGAALVAEDEDANDGLVSASMATVSEGVTVATGSCK
jgi:hypothetical protein